MGKQKTVKTKKGKRTEQHVTVPINVLMRVGELAIICDADQQRAAPAIEHFCVCMWASRISVVYS